MRTAVQTAHDLGRRLLARKLAEVLLDVLDFERALLELVLRDVIFHGSKRELYTNARDRSADGQARLECERLVNLQLTDGRR